MACVVVVAMLDSSGSDEDTETIDENHDHLGFDDDDDDGEDGDWVDAGEDDDDTDDEGGGGGPLDMAEVYAALAGVAQAHQGGAAAGGGVQAAAAPALPPLIPPPPPPQQQQQPTPPSVPPLTTVGALIPKHTGHTCSSMLGHLLVVLGGGNRRQFHSFRSLLMLDTRTMTWTKPQARGDAPNSLIYHSCTPLELHNARHLLLYGGSYNTTHRQHEARQVFLLDLLTLRWECPTILGPTPEHRTRHTLVPLYPEYYHNDMSSSNSSSSNTTTPTTTTTTTTQTTTHLVLFGGYAPQERQAFNDLMVLRVDKVMGGGGGGSSSQGRVRHSYAWNVPTVIGQRPQQRLAHTAAVIPLPPSEGGPRMVVFGGVGLGAIYGDLHSLRCQDPTYLVWEELTMVEGTPPSAR